MISLEFPDGSLLWQQSKKHWENEMKLIDLLVKKTNEEGWVWPGKSTFCYQTKPEHGYITKFFDRNGVKVVDYCWEKCDDASVFNELTKAQYEDALAASDDRLEQDLNECIGQAAAPEWCGEGLPPVGCECEAIHRSCDSWQPIKVIAVNGGAVFGFWAAGGTPCALPIEVYQFRPLRSESEKSREKLAASLHIAAGASPIELNGIGPLYFNLADAIISGSVFGTTFKENK